MTDPKWQKPVFINPDKLEPSPVEFTRPAQSFEPEKVEKVVETFEEQLKRPPQSRWRRYLLYAIATLSGTVAVSELYRFVAWGFELHSIIGFGFATLIGLVTGGILFWLAQSMRGLRQLDKIRRLQMQAQELLNSKQHGHAQALLRQLDKQYLNTPLNEKFKDTIRQVDSAYNDNEIVRFVSSHALKEQDAAALRCVRQHSVQSGLILALSPYASIDMLIVGWRNVRMLQDLASIYGIHPGAATQWKLLGQVFHNIAFSGLSEMLIDVGTQTLGGGLTGQLSARAGQGVGAALFTARTGIHAINLCRPLPLSEKGKKSFAKMKVQVIEDVAAAPIKDSLS